MYAIIYSYKLIENGGREKCERIRNISEEKLIEAKRNRSEGERKIENGEGKSRNKSRIT